MYAFLFDKRSLVLAIAGALLIGSLLFVAGLLVGLRQGLDEPPLAAPGNTETAAYGPPGG